MKIVQLLFYLLLNQNCESSEYYLNNLVKYIKEISGNYQVVLFPTNQDNNLENDFIVNKIISQIPGLVINEERSMTNNSNLMNFSVFDEPRATSLFLVIDVGDIEKSIDSRISNSINFINALSINRIRPKCLVISYCRKENCVYEKFLRYMWSKNFLDVSILQLKIKQVSNNFFFINNLTRVVIHEFNPFTDEYKRRIFIGTTHLFSDKLEDMNGFKLKAGVYHRLPYSRLTFNSTGHLIDHSGADVITLNVIAGALNFSTAIITSINTTNGVICEKNNSGTGLYGNLTRNEIDMISTSILFSRHAKGAVSEFTDMINWEYVYALVPILPGRKKTIEQTALYQTAFIFILVMIFIHLISRIFYFDSKQWEIINIAAILLGTSTPEQPRKIGERVLYALAIITGFCYASSFFAGITSLNLEATTEMEFNTFEDLDNSGLTLMVNANMLNATFGEADGALLNLKKKSIINVDCPNLLAIDKFKNVSCVLGGSSAAAVIQMSRDNFGRYDLKVMKEPFWSSRSVINLARGSPYVDRFNEVIIRLRESGLREKWSVPYSRAATSLGGERMKPTDIDDFGFVKNLQQRLIFVFIHGYLISIVVFVVELLFYRCRNFHCSWNFVFKFFHRRA